MTFSSNIAKLHDVRVTLKADVTLAEQVRGKLRVVHVSLA